MLSVADDFEHRCSSQVAIVQNAMTPCFFKGAENIPLGSGSSRSGMLPPILKKPAAAPVGGAFAFAFGLASTEATAEAGDGVPIGDMAVPAEENRGGRGETGGGICVGFACAATSAFDGV